GLRRRQVTFAWLCWVRSIEDAQRVVHWKEDNLSSFQALPDIFATIEQRAEALGVPLTPHDKAIERARELSQRLNDTLRQLQASGAMRALHASYRLHPPQ